MYISMLRSYIKAIGGDLEVIAKLPDGEVRISNFADQPEREYSFRCLKLAAAVEGLA